MNQYEPLQPEHRPLFHSPFGWIKCLWKGHKYRPWNYVRRWHERLSKNVAKEESQYECCCCGKKTKWMSGNERKAFLKANKPDWKN